MYCPLDCMMHLTSIDFPLIISHLHIVVWHKFSVKAENETGVWEFEQRTATGDTLDSQRDKYLRCPCCSSEPSALLCSVLFRAQAFCFMPSRLTTLLCFAGAERQLHLLQCPVCLRVWERMNKYEDKISEWDRGKRAERWESVKKEKKKTRKINKRKVNKLTVQRRKKNYLWRNE